MLDELSSHTKYGSPDKRVVATQSWRPLMRSVLEQWPQHFTGKVLPGEEPHAIHVQVGAARSCAGLGAHDDFVEPVS